MPADEQQVLGQHRLVDEAAIARIITAANVSPGETIVDPGAGDGALTRPLAAAVGKQGHVVAVEVDRAMLKALRKGLPANVQVLAADVLHFRLPARVDAVVGNPPFRVVAPLLRRLLVHGVGRIVSVVPQELAERLTAAPGSDRYGKLTVSVALRASVRNLGPISKRAFQPSPDVPCALLRLDPLPAPALDDAVLERVLDAAWAARRRKAKHAFAPLATEFRVSSGDLSAFLAAHAWDEAVSTSLPPEAFAGVAGLLARGDRFAVPSRPASSTDEE